MSSPLGGKRIGWNRSLRDGSYCDFCAFLRLKFRVLRRPLIHDQVQLRVLASLR